jgi:DNA-binding FrmR family transcriptional regulator
MKINKEKQDAVKALKISKGQIEAVIKMIEDERYCVDISNQIIAAQSLLKKANLLILKQHMNHCVADAFKNDNGSEKIDEIIELLSKIAGK